jgi:hypothetical protein
LATAGGSVAAPAALPPTAVLPPLLNGVIPWALTGGSALNYLKIMSNISCMACCSDVWSDALSGAAPAS